MKPTLTVGNFLFVALVGTFFLLPAARSGAEGNNLLLWVVCLIQASSWLASLKEDNEHRQMTGDVAAIAYAILLVWELATTRFNLLDPILYPTPSAVIRLFLTDYIDLFKGLWSSLILLAGGYITALFTAIPLALLIGWRRRLFLAVSPITRVLGPIPPIVYIPYAIAVLPTFKLASMFVIFIGAFWPIFLNTLNGVRTVDRRIIDSAMVLNITESSMLLRIILPAITPAIISGANIGLAFSFILLTAAEMIGATSGLGWYVKYFSDFADYPRVIVGIIFIGMVVTVIIICMDKLEKRLLCWRV